MMKVQWEFEGLVEEMAMAQIRVERTLARYQRTIGGIQCPVHGVAPLLAVKGQGIEQLELTIETCCQTLVDETNARIQGGRRRPPAKLDRAGVATDRRRAGRRRLSLYR